jgi:hypothetical protein
MKLILTSFMAGSLLATLALAQPQRSIPVDNVADAFGQAGAQPASSRADAMAQLYHRRALHDSAARRPVDLCASARPCLPVYVITVGFQFGAVDLRRGKFQPIGPALPGDVGVGLVPGRGTSLVSLGFSGDLWAIDPSTGVTSIVGPTGLGDCSMPGSYAPNCANVIGRLDETLYATDFAQNLYSVHPVTGAAKLIGPTGIPPITVAPFSENPDGFFNVYAESLFSIHGRLYALFSTSEVTFGSDPGATPAAFRPLIPAALYEINTRTGQATWIAPTDQGLSSIVNVSGRLYGFDAVTAEIVTLDLTNGHTTGVSEVDPAAWVIVGAAPARPDPAAKR